MLNADYPIHFARGHLGLVKTCLASLQKLFDLWQLWLNFNPWWVKNVLNCWFSIIICIHTTHLVMVLDAISRSNGQGHRVLGPRVSQFSDGYFTQFPISRHLQTVRVNVCQPCLDVMKKMFMLNICSFLRQHQLTTTEFAILKRDHCYPHMDICLIMGESCYNDC